METKQQVRVGQKWELWGGDRDPNPWRYTVESVEGAMANLRLDTGVIHLEYVANMLDLQATHSTATHWRFIRDTPIDGAEGVKVPLIELSEDSKRMLKELVPNPATPASRPEPAVGQVWELGCGCRVTLGAKERGEFPGYRELSPQVVCKRASSTRHTGWAPESLEKEHATYVSGPIVDQTRPTCLVCGGYSLPVPEGWTPPIDQCWRRGAVIWQCNAGVDQTRPKAPNPAAPSPGVGAGQGAKGCVRCGCPRGATELCCACNAELKANDEAIKAVLPPGVAGQGPNPSCDHTHPNCICPGRSPPRHQVPCGLTTRSGIPCDLLPHQHKGKPCEVLPKPFERQRVTGLSEADLEALARPRRRP